MNTNKEIRIKGAKERKMIADNRTPQERLNLLNQKFGDGLGAKKERAKLHKLITNKGKKDETVEEALKTTLSSEVQAEMEEINKPSGKKSRAKKND